jgi:hypothetical protein
MVGDFQNKDRLQLDINGMHILQRSSIFDFLFLQWRRTTGIFLQWTK